jgi:hypothetical protein
MEYCAAYLRKGRRIKGVLAGNDTWRNPEADFMGELNMPNEIFSFGIVVSTNHCIRTLGRRSLALLEYLYYTRMRHL